MKWIAVGLWCMVSSLTFASEGWKAPQYQEIKERLHTGWNTWNTRSVTCYTLLPEGFAINLAFKQRNWLEEDFLKETLIGRRGEGHEQITPGPHTYDGSYTELTIRWNHMNARIRTATSDGDLVVLVEPLEKPELPVTLVVESAMLWNYPGLLSRSGNQLQAQLPNRTINVFTTGEHEQDYYVATQTPYLSLNLNKTQGISTGKQRTLAEIKAIIDARRADLQKEADSYGDLSEAYIAVTSGIAWNTVYEPQYDRVVSTVGRLWNEEYGGYCLFGWDNFFLAYMTSLTSRDLAYANVIEHLRGKTEEGFIPNDNRGNHTKSWDRSQPPVGAIMVKEVYKRYPERWFLEATFDDLLGWNRFWMRKRLNEGLLSFGSHKARNDLKEPATQSKRTAGYESGMDDSPMYTGVPFNKEKNTLELQDVGLTSMVIADCHALMEMAQILGRDDAYKELEERANTLSKRMDQLWSEDTGLYLNYRTDTDEPSMRLSPTLFYPLLARVPQKERAERIVKEHLLNPQEFGGEFILPSIARNDPDFPKQRYWKGAIWPPLNFLTYLSLRNYGFHDAAKELSDKSLTMFLKEWKRKGYVSENYSAITGTGDDNRLSSDRFHSWGALFGMIAFIDRGKIEGTEKPIQ